MPIGVAALSASPLNPPSSRSWWMLHHIRHSQAHSRGRRLCCVMEIATTNSCGLCVHHPTRCKLTHENMHCDALQLLLMSRTSAVLASLTVYLWC